MSDKSIKLLIRSDDLGYSQAVNYGIQKALSFGMTKSIGLMPNMPDAEHGLNLIRDLKVCIGQHTNICVGRPVTNPELIPSLVDENGNFKSSRTYRTAEKDFVNLDEAVLEVEAQLFRFRELTGREPGYFEGHAIRSANFIKALEIVADKYNQKFSSMYIPGCDATVGGKMVHRCGMDSMNPDYDPFESLKTEVERCIIDMPNIFVCHPGYLDDYLLRTSTLTVNRTREVAMLVNPVVLEWLDTMHVDLISYDDIG